ncbi:hypothetical protein [Marinobacter algicola]|uniref:Uncharacterized protein n=1 Tax=Marinobacter algicola DG893 TaxID=443152 RepID=A6F2L5_9GAMM|nr:hypothetical protein [Marinobacter algicola]EDM46960.1 hypothetical protein MDG893_16002 [Marinobacter algicola DG893]
MNEPLSYTTTVMSWNFLLSSFRNAEAAGSENETIDLNLETPSSIVLCGISIEAFCNELSSLSRAFAFAHEKQHRLLIDDGAGVDQETLNQLCSLSQDGSGSFYDRYKRVIKLFGEKSPAFLEELVHLKNLRDALVHFRSCDVPIGEGEDGVIRYSQEVPTVLRSLKKKKVSGRELVAVSEDSEWTLRVSTSAMAIWALNLTCDAILFLLDSLPDKSFKEFVLQAYRPRDTHYRDLFSKGKSQVLDWQNQIFV